MGELKAIVLLALLAFVGGCGSSTEALPPTITPQPSQVELTVAAAADLQFAFTKLAQIFEAESGHKVTLVFGSTGQLAQQIANGAPYDLFAAANVEFVDDLIQQRLALDETKQLYARGRIVLAVSRSPGMKIEDLDDLLSPEINSVAIANPTHAPYGRAAQQALEAAGLWDHIQSKLVFGDNVRQALQFVQSGNAQAGIVALSIANTPEITWTVIDEALHAPLDQALVVVAASRHKEEAQAFAAFIGSPAGQAVMEQYGFIPPGASAPATAE
jgi:molybdate transport system substrate-binding protein